MTETASSPFKLSRFQTTALIVDGAYLYRAARLLGFDIEFAALRQHVEQHGTLHYARYINCMADLTDEEVTPYQPITKLADWLEHNGWRVIIDVVKEFQDSLGRRRIRNNIAPIVATELMEAAYNRIDHVILFGGDAGYTYPVEGAQRRGSRVTVVGTRANSGALGISSDLRRQADHFVELADLKPMLLRREVAADGSHAAHAPPSAPAPAPTIGDAVGYQAAEATEELPQGLQSGRGGSATTLRLRPAGS